MGKLRRGNYVFVTWAGDHMPRHVHIYRDAKLVAKWNLEDSVAIEGNVDRRLQRLIRELVDEGKL